MATPINVSISESFSPSDAPNSQVSPYNPKPSDSVPITDSLVFERTPWHSRISEIVPFADSFYADVPHYVEERFVMQEMVSSQAYQPPPSNYRITAESPSGVIPQVGSAIYTKWQHLILKEIQVTRAMHAAVPDPEETGRERISGLRNYWSLEINVGASVADTMWAFILAHYGAGIPFYFYDLQNNDFFYDDTGVSTNGRYMVRLVPDSFSRNQEQGSRQYARFVIAYDVIEVGA